VGEDLLIDHQWKHKECLHMEGLGAHPVLDVRKEEQYWKKPYIE
jgi:hypothetical protein